MALHTITIPGWHPARLNKLLGHWGRGFRLKRSDRQMVGVYAKVEAQVPPAESKRRVSLHLTLEPRQRSGDPDAYWKSTLDALVACKALKDDSRTWCELGLVTFERGPKMSTAITLEDVP